MTHSITIREVGDDESTAHAGTFACDAPVGARCRLWCNEDHDMHYGDEECEKVDQGYCLSIEGWFDDAWAWEECYDGEGKPDHSGEIAFTFHGEYGVTWHYASEAARAVVAG
ncbi:hypothetical protein QE392_001403 [Microbacterium proteolyticum]|uniref:hypothetical protein n=1 Tax=Microbacterium proteolyticum TaxID=1572644 RepID=UPI0027851328|nr:hypothetical protein [Microbacterium proteolyticum]MDQ1169599.1 hypothetical protein [Microbacterium proteolyticum]